MLARRFFPVFLTALLVSATAFAAAPNGALALAAERGDQAQVRSLIRQGADVNASGVDGSTPLHRAVFADRLDVASLW
jgi:ankyrin repeat protein